MARVAEVGGAEIGELVGQGPIMGVALLAPRIVRLAVLGDAGGVADDVGRAEVIDVDEVDATLGAERADLIGDVGDGPLEAGASCLWVGPQRAAAARVIAQSRGAGPGLRD